MTFARRANASPALLTALVRVGVVAGAGVGAHIDRTVRLDTSGFHITLLFAGVYGVVVFASVLTGHWRYEFWAVCGCLDLVLLAILTYTSGGPYSELRLAFILVPVAAAFVGKPRHVLWTLVGGLAAYGTACLAYVDVAGEPVRHALVEVAGAGVRSVLVGALAVVLIQRTDRASRLADRSRALVAELLSAEERERKRVAASLHDAPLQNLYIALNALRRRDADPEGVDVAEVLLEGTIEQLRGVLTDLYPPTLEHAGLGPALQALADEKRFQGGPAVVVDIDGPEVPRQWDRLLFSAARELLSNVAKHADADTAWVRLRAHEQTVFLEVEDDGAGFAEGARARARRDGHIGLAALEDRLAAVGGQLEILSAARGARVRLTLPVRRVTDRESDRSPVAPTPERVMTPSAAMFERRRGASA